VAIRTAVVDREAGAVEFGVGSGIVWDSDAADEYAECLLKGSILGRRAPRFDLLETLRWSPPEGFFLLDRHMTRLLASAEYFGFDVKGGEVQRALEQAVAGQREAQRIRLLVPRRGPPRVERSTLRAAPGPLRVTVARHAIDPSEVLLYHKTTERSVYEQARIAGVDDVLLWNPAGEVTEATNANIVVEIDGALVTPPIACGLLGGTYRAELLERGSIRERIVTLGDLRRAQAVWLINSVYERRAAIVVAQP
jgi:para-aminobenzoate synthetase/4-amino-4-deoxychorismate lyase